MADLQKIVTDLSSLTVLEAAELAKFIDALCGSSIGLEGPADVWTLTAAGTEKFERDG